MANYYDILGIATDSDLRTIKSAYRSLAKKCHPDISTDCGDEFRILKEAFDTLADPQKRRSYDRDQGIYHNSKNNAYRDGRVNIRPMARDLFDDVVDVLADRFHIRRKKKLDFDLYLSDSELERGMRTVVTIPQEKICPACFGFGGTLLRVCSSCNGSGIVDYDVEFDLVLEPPLEPGQVYEVVRGGYVMRFSLKRGNGHG